MHTLYFRIADFDISIESNRFDLSLLYNYIPFRVQQEEVSSLLFAMQFGEMEKPKGKVIRTYKLAGMELSFYLNSRDECSVVAYSPISGATYMFRACNQWTDIRTDLTLKNPEEYVVLDYFLMLAFIYSSSLRDTVLIHASCICCKEQGVAFIGHSGVGKSTHSRMWLEHIEGAELLNDDQPAVRIIGNDIFLYGTPWSGKTPCYKSKRVPLNALFLMEQADENKLNPLSPFVAFRRLLSSCSMIQEERNTFNCIVKSLVAIAESVKVYELKNKPERAAAELAYAHSIGKERELNRTKRLSKN